MTNPTFTKLITPKFAYSGSVICTIFNCTCLFKFREVIGVIWDNCLRYHTIQFSPPLCTRFSCQIDIGVTGIFLVVAIYLTLQWKKWLVRKVDIISFHILTRNRDDYLRNFCCRCVWFWRKEANAISISVVVATHSSKKNMIRYK